MCFESKFVRHTLTFSQRFESACDPCCHQESLLRSSRYRYRILHAWTGLGIDLLSSESITW